MFRNMASWDSLIRLVLAAGSIGAFIALHAAGWAAAALMVFAGIMTLTALTRFCPIYRVCGLRTGGKGDCCGT